MKKINISKSILSISSPGVYLDPSDPSSGRKLARQCNDFANELVERRPSEFGFWAALPLPDVEGSLQEIQYAAEALKPDGFVLETNHHGIYLGDPTFDAVFDELNRRKATVFIHPTSPCIRHASGNTNARFTALPQFPNPMFEFMFDTARALINLFLSGTISRCPNITFVIPHAAGALPPVIQRFCSIATDVLRSELEINIQVVRETFQRQFYFDLAGFPFPDQIAGLLRYVQPDRLLYGTDFPFTPATYVEVLAKTMQRGFEETFPDAGTRTAIYTTNAQRLLESKNSHRV